MFWLSRAMYSGEPGAGPAADAVGGRATTTAVSAAASGTTARIRRRMRTPRRAGSGLCRASTSARTCGYSPVAILRGSGNGSFTRIVGADLRVKLPLPWSERSVRAGGLHAEVAPLHVLVGQQLRRRRLQCHLAVHH